MQLQRTHCKINENLEPDWEQEALNHLKMCIPSIYEASSAIELLMDSFNKEIDEKHYRAVEGPYTMISTV